MEQNKQSISEMIAMYKNDVEMLVRYLPWLESKSGEKMYSSYTPENSRPGAGLKVPVYDSTLLQFVKTAQKTKFMNKNYVYTFSRKKLKTAEDEHKFIDKCQIMDMAALGDILSMYVLKGMTKGTLWSEGVSNGVLSHTVKRMKELIEFWSVPM